MTQPAFVPIATADQVRPALRLEVPQGWKSDRPAEARHGGPRAGSPGPDQGYALSLAHHFEDRIEVGAGESKEDVLIGAAMLASHRSAHFGRAPSGNDLKVALECFGFFGEPPTGQALAYRRRAFLGASHHYDVQRRLVADAPPSLLAPLTRPPVADAG